MRKESRVPSREAAKTIAGSGDLEILWWWTFVDLSLLYYKEDELEKNSIVEEEKSGLQSEVPAI